MFVFRHWPEHAPARESFMAKEKAVAPGFIQGLFQFGFYKRSQGRITRQATFGVLAVVFALAAYRLYNNMQATNSESIMRFAAPLAILIGGIWAAFRMVHTARFADFLIAVEAEMNKVSWPSRTELVRSSMVVIFVIFAMAAVLFVYDIVWQVVFTFIGIKIG